MRIKQTRGRSVLVTGYAKYLNGSDEGSQEYRISINDLPIDEFGDCASSGSPDSFNLASDLPHIQPDEDGLGWYEAYSDEMTLFGDHSIIGKSLVVYASANDYNLDVVSDGDLTSTDNSVVEEKRFHMTNAQEYVKQMGKPVACCTIKPAKYF